MIYACQKLKKGEYCHCYDKGVFFHNDEDINRVYKYRADDYKWYCSKGCGCESEVIEVKE